MVMKFFLQVWELLVTLAWAVVALLSLLLAVIMALVWIVICIWGVILVLSAAGVFLACVAAVVAIFLIGALLVALGHGLAFVWDKFC